MSENIIPEGSTPIAVTPPAEGAPAPAPEAVPAAEAAPAAVPEAPALSQEAQQYNYEREMFSAGAASNGMELPGNFKDFGDYFDSLKEAQGQYTSARQELATLKAEQAANLINPEEPVEGEAVEGEEVELPDSLEIKEPEAEAEGEGEEGDYEVYEVGMTEEEAMNWTSEYMETGELGEETMESILKSFPGATEEMVNVYFQGLKSLEQQSVQTAASAVGGETELNNILQWAGQNLSPAEREAANAALAGPMADTTLRGLQARYQAAQGQTRAATEPTGVPNRVASAAAAEPLSAYGSPAEMNADIANPQYHQDPQYRALVQQRMAKTPWLTGG